MPTIAQIPLNFELPHVLILVWLGAGCFALWIAQKLHLPRQKSVSILLPMALGLMVFTLYIGTRFNYDFLIDDIDIVQTNPDVVEANGWKTLWTHDYWSGRSTDDNLYRPVTILSYWINARLPMCGIIVNGRAVEVYPRYFRGVNIILLTMLAWLIALWLSHYVQLTAAWAVAFLFAGHSIHAEMVNYVVCRADLLAMLGVVGFLYMQRLATEAGRWKWWSAALALVSAIVAVGSKESGWILIPAALVQAWIGSRHANTEVTDDLIPTPRSVTIGWIVLLGVPAVLYFAGRFSVVGLGVDYVSKPMDDMRDNPLRTLSFMERIPAAFAIVWFYFKQIFVPNTSYYHLPVDVPGWTSADTIRGITVTAVACILVVGNLRRHRWQAIALILAAGQLLLIDNPKIPVGVYAANRLILPFTLAAAILGAAFIHWFCGASARRRAVVMLPTAAILTLMAFETQEVNFVWRTEARLLGRDRDLAPNHPVAKYNLGTVRAREAIYIDRYIRAVSLAIDLTDKVESAMHNPNPGSLQTEMKDSLARIRQEIAVPLETSQHLEQIQVLREVISLYDRTSLQGVAVLTPEDIAGASKRLREERERSVALSEHHWKEALDLLGEVIDARPQSLSARIELARAFELHGDKEKARAQYRDLVNTAKALSEENDVDLRVIEARIRYGKLCIDLSLDKIGAEKSLAIAELTLARLLQDESKLTPGQRKDLHALNRNAKRYLGIVAWKDGRIRTAIKRHAELLKQYSDFKEAWADLTQWTDQQRPYDAHPEHSPDDAPRPVPAPSTHGRDDKS